MFELERTIGVKYDQQRLWKNIEKPNRQEIKEAEEELVRFRGGRSCTYKVFV